MHDANRGLPVVVVVVVVVAVVVVADDADAGVADVADVDVAVWDRQLIEAKMITD
jgi:hypothetical protein